MKKLIILSAILISIGMPAVAMAEVTTRVCEADGTTLFDNRDIMVGTKLTIIVQLHIFVIPGPATSLFLEITQNYGVLSGRDFNDSYRRLRWFSLSRCRCKMQWFVDWTVRKGIQGL